MRHELGISQEELGFRCGLHRTYISDLERGLRNVSFGGLLAIARGLETTISELTRGIEMPATNTVARPVDAYQR